MHLHIVAVLLVVDVCAASLQPQIPSIQWFQPDQVGRVFVLGPETQIIVDKAYAFLNDGSHSDGPTLLRFAENFRSDLIHPTSYALPPVQVVPFSHTHLDGGSPSIVLTLGSSSNHTLYSGIPTRETYEFFVLNSSYIISGSGSIGAWWGTRTLLKQLVLSEQGYGTYTFPTGNGSDGPGWEVRGFMLDAGRHWYTTEFLAEICTYASFKINEFHIYASDNLWIPSLLYGHKWRSLYSRFRFQSPRNSPIVGLVPHRNESWSSTQFADMQSRCAQRGVTIDHRA